MLESKEILFICSASGSLRLEHRLKWEARMTWKLELNKSYATKNKTPHRRLVLVINKDVKIVSKILECVI